MREYHLTLVLQLGVRIGMFMSSLARRCSLGLETGDINNSAATDRYLTAETTLKRLDIGSQFVVTHDRVFYLSACS